MRVFIDTNILIDFVVNREGFSEDATQNATALRAEGDCIVTRNKKDFTDSSLPVYTPAELLNILNQEPTLKSKACIKCLYFTIIIFDLCRYLEYFSYLYTINQTE